VPYGLGFSATKEKMEIGRIIYPVLVSSLLKFFHFILFLVFGYQKIHGIKLRKLFNPQNIFLFFNKILRNAAASHGIPSHARP
jgi:hypothetical protein